MIQTRVLTDYMENLCQKPNRNLATFCRIRPKHIHLTTSPKRNVLLFTKHQNISLKLQIMRKAGIDVPKNLEIVIKKETVISKSQLLDTVQYTKWKIVKPVNKK